MNILFSILKKLREEAKEQRRKQREACKLKFKESSKNIISTEDAQSVKAGDMICVGDFMGVVLSINSDFFVAIPAFRDDIYSGEWYEDQVYCIPDIHRTESSLRNSISHWIISDAISTDDGEANQKVIESYLTRVKGPDYKYRYNYVMFPAFEYCMNSTDGCYLPAIDELVIFNNQDLLKNINGILQQYNADVIVPTEGEFAYWSSTDDYNKEYCGLQDNFISDSAAYAVRIYSDGSLEKVLISKSTHAHILPYYKYRFNQ